MTDWATPIAVSSVSVEVQAIAVLVVISALWLLSSIIPPVIAAVVAAFLSSLFSAIIAIRISNPTLFAITGDFSILQVWISRSSGDRFVLSLLLVAQNFEHRLESLARNVGVTNRPDRRQEFPVMWSANIIVTRGQS